MKVLEKISDFAGKWMAIIALAVAIIAFVAPAPVHATLPTSCVNPLLGIVMFGMGMTLKLGDFKVVFTKPKAVITGILSQFIIMPLIAWVLCLVFQLPTELAVGVMLVGCCPGGTSSNVMTYLSKGDVALSVGMTACTTIMAPVVTPALVLLLAGQSVDVSYVSMLLSIVQVVLVPIALGFVINAVASKVAQACSKVLPLVSVIAISLIIMAVVSANALYAPKKGEDKTLLQDLLDSGAISGSTVVIWDYAPLLFDEDFASFLFYPVDGSPASFTSFKLDKVTVNGLSCQTLQVTTPEEVSAYLASIGYDAGGFGYVEITYDEDKAQAAATEHYTDENGKTYPLLAFSFTYTTQADGSQVKGSFTDNYYLDE